MTKQDIVNLWNALNFNFGEQKLPVKFSYFLAKNKNKIKHEVEVLSEINKPDNPKFQEYEEKRMGFIKELAIKDGEGQPLLINNEYRFVPENRGIFESKMEALRHQYKDVIAEQEAKNKQFIELLKDPIDDDLKLHNIKFQDLPDEINQNVMDSLVSFDLIMEE